MEPLCEDGNAPVCVCACVCGVYAPPIFHAFWLQTFQIQSPGLWGGTRKQPLLGSHQPEELVFRFLPQGDLWWSLSLKTERPKTQSCFPRPTTSLRSVTLYLPIQQNP